MQPVKGSSRKNYLPYPCSLRALGSVAARLVVASYCCGPCLVVGCGGKERSSFVAGCACLVTRRPGGGGEELIDSGEWYCIARGCCYRACMSAPHSVNTGDCLLFLAVI